VPTAPYFPNDTAEPIAGATAQDFVSHLTGHVHRRVRWRESLERIVVQDPDAVFVEVGPGEVLSNLLQRRWLPNRKYKTDHPTAPLEGLRAAAASLRQIA
jgi:acyl transferase domain-containing protein